MEKYETKYPVVLVHGMVIKDFKRYRAFRKIRDNLTKNGVKVYVTNQDGLGRINTNAIQLKEEILKILKEEKVDKVNLIAHSKGGVDCRYMISKLNMDNHSASLTTLSTPHYGSKMSTNIMKMPKWFAKFAAIFINGAYRIFKDSQPDIIGLAYDVSDKGMEEFNKEVKNSTKVYYQSYSSDVENKKLFIMLLPHKFSTYSEQDKTDGIVSVESSKWGEYQGDLGNFDHGEMVGVYGNKKTLQEVSDFYLHVVEQLKNKGF